MHRYFLTLLLIFFLSGCALYASTSGQVVLKEDSKIADVRFSDRDRALIEDYYRKPASLHKASGSVKIVKGNALPSGFKGEPLPRDLERRLPSLPAPHVRLKIGQDIVLIDKTTRVVMDVMRVDD